MFLSDIEIKMLLLPALWVKERPGCTRWRWLCLLCGLLSLEAFGARSSFSTDPLYLIDTWETKDGLPENSATAMAQTREGYLWFGTFKGLVRFDGVKFTSFNPANTPQLPSEMIVNLHCDRNERLWVSTYQGLAVLESGHWRQLTKDDGWAGDYARTFAERANGDLLITAFNGKLFEFSRGHFTELPPPPGEKGRGYFGGADEEGHWWAVQSRFVGRWENGQWVKMLSPPEVPQDAVGCAPARDGGMWLLLGRELRRLRHGVEVARLTLPARPGGIWRMSEDSQGHVWIATHDRGVSRIDPKGTMEGWSATNGWSDRGRFVFEDRENNLWLGTAGDGLMRLKPRRFLNFNLGGGPKGLIVHSVSPDAAGGLWAGTYGRGVFHISDAGITNAPLGEKTGALPFVQSVLVNRAERTWVGTYGDGLWMIETQRARQFPVDQTGGHNVLALFEDSRGGVWASGGHAIAVFEADGFQRYGEKEGLPASTFVTFAEDNKGAIWVASDKGVFRRERDRFVEVRADNDQSIRGITCLQADADGSLWLGSRDHALLRWRNGRLAASVLGAGFPAKSIHGIVEDDQGFFWMTSERGIVRARRSDLHAAMDGKTVRFPWQLFDVSDGLARAEFASERQPVCTRDNRGRLWFATTKGVTMIDPAELRLNETPPTTLIEGVSFYRRPPKTGKRQAASAGTQAETQLRAPFSGQVSLPAGSHRIAIHYTALCFAAPEKVRFQVKLEGEDTDWVEANALRVAYYHDLPPKDYLFRVRAANNDNVWNEAGTSLAFSLRPFYWQAGWFRVLVALGLLCTGAGTSWAIIRSKVGDLRARERAREALRESEERYREVVDSQTDLVCRYRADTTLTFVNHAYCRYFGKRREELIGSKFLELIPRTAWKTVLEDVASLNKEHRVLAREHEVILPDGNIGWQQWVNHPIVEPDGTVAEYQAIGRDITERKRAEEARKTLAHAARVSTMGALAGSLAHELNQPLTAILSNAQAGSRFLRDPAPDFAEVRDLLQDIAQDAIRAGEVIRQLRKLVKKDELQFDLLDLRRVIHDVERLLHSDMVIKKVQLVLVLDSDLPPVCGDSVQLKQVMFNLLLNAFDAMKDVAENERKVHVCARQPDTGVVQIEVKDCGTGIPPELLARLFEPFQSTKRDGLGLGLSICRSIVEAHGGRLWAVNNTDRGATFCFAVPVAKEERTRNGQSSEHAEERKPRRLLSSLHPSPEKLRKWEACE